MLHAEHTEHANGERYGPEVVALVEVRAAGKNDHVPFLHPAEDEPARVPDNVGRRPVRDVGVRE